MPTRAWRRVAAWLEPYEAEESAARRFRARQIRAVLRLTPLAMTANVLNVALVMWAAWGFGPRGFLVAWAAAIVLLMGRGTLAVWRGRRQPPRETASRRAVGRATLQAACLGALWGAMPLVLFPAAPAEPQLLVATVTTGMICAGAFALATLPMAAAAYVVALGTSAMVALAMSSLALAPVIAALLFIYCVVVIAAARANGRLFGARLVGEAEAERQNEVIGLLLRDFEEHSSDLLWEVGPDGRLRHVSGRLARLFGQPAAVLAERPLVQMLVDLVPEDDEARQHFARLREAFRLGAPFRDLLLAVRNGARASWWSLSAKPLFDHQGRPDGWRGVATDVTAARQANRQLSWLAHNDALTGLANRHEFRTRLSSAVGERDRPPHLAVVCVDLDHFKAINDGHGHAAGDALLTAVGERLRRVTRRGGLVARLGGDEFAMLVAAADRSEVEQLGERLLQVLRRPCAVGALSLPVQASIGIALLPDDGDDVDTLLNHADLALYAAKAAGRNALRFFAPEMAAATRRRAELDRALREALAHGELRLMFQPQVTLETWEITGFEALLRWRSPSLGEVAPSEFVPVAEESGLMPALGRWVLAEACRQAARWPQPLVVAVNVSPLQAESAGFVAGVREAARAAGLPAERLELEITESVFLQDTSETLHALATLREAGVRIALDDFGTGHSALAYLRRFPLDTLKIDRSFVRELAASGDARAIVKTILGLARTLGMSTVAEGVEEPAHAAVLAKYGCQVMQGYLVARPLAAEDVPAFIAEWRGRPEAPWPAVPATDTMPLRAAG